MSQRHPPVVVSLSSRRWSARYFIYDYMYVEAFTRYASSCFAFSTGLVLLFLHGTVPPMTACAGFAAMRAPALRARPRDPLGVTRRPQAGAAVAARGSSTPHASQPPHTASDGRRWWGRQPDRARRRRSQVSASAPHPTVSADRLAAPRLPDSLTMGVAAAAAPVCAAASGGCTLASGRRRRGVPGGVDGGAAAVAAQVRRRRQAACSHICGASGQSAAADTRSQPPGVGTPLAGVRSGNGRRGSVAGCPARFPVPLRSGFAPNGRCCRAAPTRRFFR